MGTLQHNFCDPAVDVEHGRHDRAHRQNSTEYQPRGPAPDGMDLPPRRTQDGRDPPGEICPQPTRPRRSAARCRDVERHAHGGPPERKTSIAAERTLPIVKASTLATG